MFKYTGLSAKQMTDDVYVRAYITDGNDEYGKVYKYSILQYAYNMLGKTDAVTDDVKLIKTLNAMLQYGAAVQEYKNYRTENLATDSFVQIKLINGNFSDGFSKGLYKVGKNVTIKASETDASNKPFSHWEDDNGNFISNSTITEISVSEVNKSYIAVYNEESSLSKLEFTLNSDNKSYKVSGIGEKTGPEIIIPSTYNNLPVTSIGDSAFGRCVALKSITIPDTIEEIGLLAFYECVNLEDVYITDIAAWCGITFEIETSNPLNYASNLYVNGELVRDLVIPEGTKKISSFAFYNCSGFRNVELSDSVESIYDYAFYGCSGLTSITIPKGVKTLAANAFSNCQGIESIVVDKENQTYHSKNNCIINTRYTWLVVGCKNSIIPTDYYDYVRVIYIGAFRGVTGLNSITIPEHITEICSQAFYDCTDLITINYNGTINEWNAIQKGNDWDVNTGNYTIYCTDGTISK